MGVGKCVTKENPKSDLDLDLGFVKIEFYELELSSCFGYGMLRTVCYGLLNIDSCIFGILLE